MVTFQDRPASSPANPSLANRYGRPKRGVGPKGKKVLAVMALAAGAGLMAWVATSNAAGSVTFKDVSFSTVDATLTEVDFQVTRDPDKDVVCALKALDSKYAIVGWKVVKVPADAGAAGREAARTVTQRAEIRTESLAATGVVDNCWVPDVPD